jgi:hypothetical protein
VYCEPPAKKVSYRKSNNLRQELDDCLPTTRNYCSSGIFFETDQSYSPGESLEFTIILEYANSEGPDRLNCRGEISRVVESGQKRGIAATIDSYSIQEFQSEMEMVAEKRQARTKRSKIREL